MLSGIGPRADLEALGIPVRVDLPGVGTQSAGPLRSRRGQPHGVRVDGTSCAAPRFGPDDALFKEWETSRTGIYTTNGAVLAVIRRSFPDRPLPDLFCFALLGLFDGYFPGYSARTTAKPNYLTWAILKAHTEQPRRRP